MSDEDEYDLLADLADLRKENARLRAENAELREAVQFAIDSNMSYIDDDTTLEHLRAVLTHPRRQNDERESN